MVRSYAGLLKQSAATVICMGPFLDITDDVTPESGLASNMDTASGILLSKNAGTLAVRASGITATSYDTHGYYKVSLTATDVNTLGSLVVEYTEVATCNPVCQEYSIVPANVYDSLIAGATGLQVNVIQLAGSSGAVAGIADFATGGYNSTTHAVNNVSGVYVTTNLTNAATAGDLTATMKSSVSTAVAAASGIVVTTVSNPVSVSGDLTSTMKSSVETAVRNQIDAVVGVGASVGSVGRLCRDYLDTTVSSRLAPAGTLATVTNLTNAPTAGDLTSTMKASVLAQCNAATPTVAAVTGSVGSVVTKTGYKLASDGLDSVSAPSDLANDAAARSSFVGMFRALFNRFYNQVTQSSTQQIVKNDSNTAVSTMSVSVAAGVETKGKSS